MNNDLFGRYIRAIYVYFIWTVGIVATAMIVFAGVKWVAAAGDQGRIRDARDMITNAIVGVIIALTSVILLNLLSPRFSTLSIPSIDTTIKAKYYDGISISRLCDPAKDQVENFVCNNIKKIGTRVDQNNVVQSDYCISTKCDKEEVCLIRQNSVTGKYMLGNGCVKSVRIDAPAGEFANITSLPVNQNRIGGPSCGSIQLSPTLGTKNPYSVGQRCGQFESDSYCAMIGNTATIKDVARPGIDSVSNMKCP